ncbi:hypothetical protein D9M71_777940 [compost metagenome]
MRVRVLGAPEHIPELSNEYRIQAAHAVLVAVMPEKASKPMLIAVIGVWARFYGHSRLILVACSEEFAQPDGRREVVITFCHQNVHVLVFSQQHVDHAGNGPDSHAH